MKKRKNPARRAEREAVYTTIVGGRPPGSGTDVGQIPRGIEVLVKKASVDSNFRSTLIEKRAEAALEIGLELNPAEVAMLTNIPRQQLEAIITNTKVTAESRRVFLGKVASFMLAALGVEVSGCKPKRSFTKGIQPDRPSSPQEVNTLGIQPDQPNLPQTVSHGIQPDRPSWRQEPISTGIRPDLPPKKNTE